MADGTCPIVHAGSVCGRPILARRMCSRHYDRWRRTGSAVPPDPRIAAEEHIRSRLPKGAPDECWPWTGHVRKRTGYGRVRVLGFNTAVHRLAYEFTYGPIPEGLTVDHMCHKPEECAGGPTCPHRRCCNPAHLKAVPNPDNARRNSRAVANTRKTHCKYGHPFDEANTYHPPGRPGRRQCRQCKSDNARKRRVTMRRNYAAQSAEIAFSAET